MKIRVLAHYFAAAAVVLFIGLGVIATPSFADGEADEILAVMAKHDAAYNAHDLAGVMAIYAPEADTILMGTGTDEIWNGKEAIGDAYKHFFEGFDAGSATIEYFKESANIQENIAWLFVVAKFTDSLNGQDREFGANISAVLEKIDGQWYIRATHLSNVTE